MNTKTINILSFIAIMVTVSLNVGATPTPTITGGESMLLQGTIQQFEGGRMLWSHRFGVIVMIPSEGLNGIWYQPRWGDVPATVDETPPEGLLAPSSAGAIGKVWAQFPDIQEKLGWAIFPERPQPFIVRYVDTTPDSDMIWFPGDGAWYYLVTSDNTYQFDGYVHNRYIADMFENFPSSTPAR